MFFFTGVYCTLEMSLSIAWRDRRALTEQLAGAEIDAFFAQVQESGDSSSTSGLLVPYPLEDQLLLLTSLKLMAVCHWSGMRYMM